MNESIAALDGLVTVGRSSKRQTSSAAVAASDISSPDVAAAFRRLWSLEGLRENWNSYTARAIEISALRSGHSLIETASNLRMLPMAIIPTAQGGVQLEWRLSDREIEIEISPDETAHVLITKSGQDMELPSIPARYVTKDILSQLFHG